MPEKMGAIELPEVATAADLLKLGFEDDQLLLEDASLCTVCTSTCTVTKSTL